MRLNRLLAACACLVACEHAPPSATSWVPAGEDPPPLVLNEAPLPATEQLDRALDGLNAIGAHRQVWDWLIAVMDQMDRPQLQKSDAVRRLLADAVVRVSRAPDFMEHFASVRRAVDLLTEVAPDSPEAHFCRAYMRWILLADGHGSMRLGELDARVAVDLATDLRFLTTRAPTWHGPQEFDPARLRLELQRTEALIASLPAPATPETAR